MPVLAFVTALCVACMFDLGSAKLQFKLVDLTHELNNSTVYWPGNPDYEFRILGRGQKPDFWYEANYLGTAEHGGTHLDAPAHFYKGGWRTQQIPIMNLQGPAAVIDVKSKAAANPDYRVTIGDVTSWESQHGQIPDRAVVIMNSGWSGKYPNKTDIFQTPTPNDPSTFHFPAWHIDTVKWLINKRHPVMLGVDTPSTDYGQSKTFPVHVALGKDNILGLENVAHLDKIPQSGTFVFAAVVKIGDGSGGPARVFAQIFDDDATSSSAWLRAPSSYTRVVCFVIQMVCTFSVKQM